MVDRLKDEDIKGCITRHESGLDFLAGSMRPETGGNGPDRVRKTNYSLCQENLWIS